MLSAGGEGGDTRVQGKRESDAADSKLVERSEWLSLRPPNARNALLEKLRMLQASKEVSLGVVADKNHKMP